MLYAYSQDRLSTVSYNVVGANQQHSSICSWVRSPGEYTICWWKNNNNRSAAPGIFHYNNMFACPPLFTCWLVTGADLLMRVIGSIVINMFVGPRLPGAYMTAPVASIIMISFRGANDSLPATPVRVAKLNWSEGCLQFSVLWYAAFAPCHDLKVAHRSEGTCCQENTQIWQL